MFSVYVIVLTFTEDCLFTVVSADPSSNLSPLHEEISMQDSGTVVKKLSIPEPQLAPVVNAAILGMCDEGEGSGHFCNGFFFRRFNSSVIFIFASTNRLLDWGRA